MISPIAAAHHPTLGLQQGTAGSITTQSADPALYAEPGDDVYCAGFVNKCSLNAAYGLTDNLTLGFNLTRVSRTNIRERVVGSPDSRPTDIS